jgi:hypothetical protein
LQAESIVKSIAPANAVSNQIVIVKQGDKDNANDIRVINPDLNQGNGKNPDGALAIFSQIDPRSHCQAHTDVYLQLRTWAIVPEDALLPLAEIALRILRQEENQTPRFA